MKVGCVTHLSSGVFRVRRGHARGYWVEIPGRSLSMANRERSLNDTWLQHPFLLLLQTLRIFGRESQSPAIRIVRFRDYAIKVALYVDQQNISRNGVMWIRGKFLPPLERSRLPSIKRCHPKSSSTDSANGYYVIYGNDCFWHLRTTTLLVVDFF